MANVRLKFISPSDEEGLVTLEIYEGTAKTGPFGKIDQTNQIGAFPDYIDEYTTTLAANENDWFAIDWVDSKGGNLGLSQPIKGGTLSLVAEITDRVLLRDPILDDAVVLQEAEAVVESYFKLDPYLVTETVNYETKSGLTLLTMARCYLFSISEGMDRYVAGIVSQQTQNARTLQNVQALIRQAEAQLGISFSVICQMFEIEIAGGTAISASTVDQSRLLIEQS